MKVTLKSDRLEVTIDTFGAELQSVRNVKTNTEYLWHGDKRWWGRRSPVLFPIVGSVWEGEYRMDGKTYHLGQHGFARDSEFEMQPDTADNEAWFTLNYSDATLALYPRRFRLEIGYRLDDDRLQVMWRVTNLDNVEMDFQIGAHPAFNYPGFNPNDEIHGYLAFSSRKLRSQLLDRKGCIGSEEMDIELDSEHMLPVTARTFDINTIILADSQVNRVSLLDKNRAPWISVIAQAPLTGIWSPSADCPFICIEPWWGRADRVDFKGDFAEREHINRLAPAASFNASYLIIFES